MRKGLVQLFISISIICVSAQYSVGASNIASRTCTFPVDKIIPVVSGDLSISLVATPAGCAPNTGTITATASGGTQPYQYSMDGSSYQGSGVFTATPGHHDITVKDAGGSTASSGISVPLVEDLTLQTLPDTSVCKGTPLVLLTSSNGLSFSWQPETSLNSATLKDPVATPPETTRYIVTATMGNCIKKDTVIVTVNPPVGISITTMPATCIDNKGTIILGGSGGTPPYLFALEQVPYQSINTFRTFPGTLVAFVKDAKNCSTYAAATVSLINSLSLQTRSDSSICLGQPVKLSTSSNATSFSWQPVSGLDDPNIKDPVASPTSTTNYTLTATLGSCTRTATVKVTVTKPVAISVETLPAICGDSKGTLNITAEGGEQPYQYSLDKITYQDENIFNVPPGTYLVYVKDVNKCSAFTSVTVITLDSLTLQTRSDTSVCAGQPVKLLTASNAAAFSWQPASALDNSTSKEPIARPLFTTDYIVTATKGTCSKKDTVSIIITQPLVISTTILPATCSGNAMGAITANVTGGAPPYRYSLNGAAYQNQNTFSVAPAQYTISVIDANNCTNNITASVGSFNDIVLQTIPDTILCQGQSIELATSGNVSSYSWQPAEGLNNATFKSPVASATISTDYVVTATRGNCIKKDTVHISVGQSISVVTKADPFVMADKPFQLMAYSPQLAGAAGITYLWTPATGLNDKDIANPTATLKNDQTYKVAVTSMQGCTGTGTINIKVVNGTDIFVPTGFTPNSDGANDILKPICFGLQSLKYFKIFNRWGQLVYSTSVLNQGWEGTVQGITQPAGTYIWIVEGTTIFGQVIVKKGSVVLIR